MSPPHILTKGNRVLILGAGVTGKMAAIESHDLGLSPIVIEKRQRSGGRATTDVYADRFFDGGAHMLHGGPANPVAQWLEKNATPHVLTGLGVQHFRDLIVEDRLDNLWTIRGDGSALRNADFRVEGMRAIRLAFRDFQRQHRDNPGIDLPLADAVKLVPPAQRDVAELYAKLAGWMWQGTTPERVSLYELCGPYADDDKSGGVARPVDWIVKGGLGWLFNKVADTMLAERGVPVYTGRDVQRVREEGDGFVVECKQTDGSGVIFFGRAVTSTLSFGALKGGVVRFEPGLPQDLRDRIDVTPMGNLAKIQVPFETGALAARGIKEQQRVYVFDHEPGRHFFSAFSVYNDSMDIYGMDLGGLDVLQARKVVAGITGAFDELRGLDAQMVADPLVTNPLPNFGGAYPICLVGQKRPEGLYVVRDGGLSFAGDGFVSDEDEAGTVVGAFISGRAAAQHNRHYLHGPGL